MPRSNGAVPVHLVSEHSFPFHSSRSSGGPVDPAISDLELVEGIRASSEAHFRVLYERYFDRIYGYVHRRLRNHADTEEIVQETFLSAHASLANYRGQSSLLAWIYGIARNSVNSHIRRCQSRRQKIEHLPPEQPLIAQAHEPLSSPEDQLLLKRCTQSIEARLASVADWQIEVFELRHVHDLGIGEISRRTGRSSDAVRSSLYRIKRLLVEAVDRAQEGHRA